MLKIPQTNWNENCKSSQQAVQMKHVVIVYVLSMPWQGEALRQSLLTRYYGKSHPRARRDSGSPPGQQKAPANMCGPGSVMLSRAEMTLAAVQVRTQY